MPFTKVTSEKLATAVIRQVENLILRGILRPGDRLPPERELSERLGVSRPSLRGAVADLSERGLLETRAGAGVYVADVLGNAFSPALTSLFASHDDALLDYIAFRRDLEGLAAARAARKGSESNLKLIATLLHKMERAHTKRDPSEEAALDADFHMAIIEASHNVITLHMMRSMMDLLRRGVFYNRSVMFRERATRDVLLDHHRAINAAIQSRDAAAAQGAVHEHLDFVRNCVRDMRDEARHEVVAKLRLEQESTR